MYPVSLVRVKASCMMRRWNMCSSKSSSIRPPSKNGPITGSQARCEKSLLRLEKTACVASGPSAITEDRAGDWA